MSILWLGEQQEDVTCPVLSPSGSACVLTHVPCLCMDESASIPLEQGQGTCQETWGRWLEGP